MAPIRFGGLRIFANIKHPKLRLPPSAHGEFRPQGFSILSLLSAQISLPSPTVATPPAVAGKRDHHPAVHRKPAAPTPSTAVQFPVSNNISPGPSHQRRTLEATPSEILPKSKCEESFSSVPGVSDEEQFQNSFGTKQDQAEVGTRQSLCLVGLNIRSLFKVGNIYSVYKLLGQRNPDILLLNETWHDALSKRTLLDSRYNLLLSDGEGSGGGVGIIAKKALLLMPLFPEFHNRNLMMFRLSSLKETCPMIILAVYFPPDERRWDTVSHLSRIVEFLKTRYSSFNLVGYCDLNADLKSPAMCSSAKRINRALSRIGIRVCMSSNATYTRLQGAHRSYLDYFLTINVELSTVTVGAKVGSSDHLPITSSILSSAPILRSKRLIFSKRLAREALSYLRDPAVSTKPPLRLFNGLSTYSKSISLIYEPPPKSHFRTIDSVETEMGKSLPDWNKISKMILQCRQLEFLALLEGLNRLKLEGLPREFHRTVQRVLGMKGSSSFSSVNEIMDPDDPNQILFEPHRLRERLSSKYRSLFCSDDEFVALEPSRIDPVDSAEILEAIKSIKTNKGLALDCISDSILVDPSPEVLGKLVGLVNIILSKGVVPAPFCQSRLHLLNKLGTGVPGLGDLRPIMISSPVVKLIESIALRELRVKLQPRISKAQVGFLPHLGTQTHLLRLLGRMKDIQANPGFRPLTWHVLFIDFKSAFDRVNHEMLFSKLQRGGITERTLSILKVLYNSYHFTLPSDKPRKINSGVAQGSLVSPLLFDLYVNDLIEQLSGQFGEQNVFAYADDIAILCLGYSDIRSAMESVENWAETNSMELNKKKCGILSVCKRSMPIRRKEINGVPFVKEYKYLGVPLDQSLTLKHLWVYLKKKLKGFSFKIHTLMHSVIGTKAKLDLWKTYQRCYFDYFTPSIVVCNQSQKFFSSYTSSLKKALDLPQQTPNLPLLQLARIPSLCQIAGHHIFRNTRLIMKRFNSAPQRLMELGDESNHLHREYIALKRGNPTVTRISDNEFLIDLLNFGEFLSKNTLGLAAGTFLNLRYKKNDSGEVSTLKSCPTCHLPATQSHFVDDCPSNDTPRGELISSIPPGFIVTNLRDKHINLFYANLRHLSVSTKTPLPTANLSNQFTAFLLKLGQAAKKAADDIVSNSLRLCNPLPNSY